MMQNFGNRRSGQNSAQNAGSNVLNQVNEVICYHGHSVNLNFRACYFEYFNTVFPFSKFLHIYNQYINTGIRGNDKFSETLFIAHLIIKQLMIILEQHMHIGSNTSMRNNMFFIS